jgi:hypothetical protein
VVVTFFKLKPGQSRLFWSFIDQTQHAPTRKTELPTARNPNVQSGGWYLLHVRHAPPHTAEHRENPEVSKKFLFRTQIRLDPEGDRFRSSLARPVGL